METGTTQIQSLPRRKGRASRLLFWFVAVVALAAIGTVYGFNQVYQRRGEKALSMVPANASMVAIVDLQPSMGQYMAFRKISESLDAHGFSAKAAQGLESLFQSIPESKELKPYIRPSFAFAMTADRQEGPGGYVLLSVTDTDAVEKVISRGQPSPVSSTTKMYMQKDAPVYAGIVDGYLLLSSSPNAAVIVDRVRGDGTSLSNSDSFKKMRANIDPDANIMVFVTKDGAQQLQQAAGPSGPSQGDLSSFAVGFAIRDTGISVTSFAPTPDHPTAQTQAMMSMKPLRADLFSHLPTGAYSVWAISDSAKYYEAFRASVLGKTPQAEKNLKEADDAFQKEFGISIEEAVHRSLSGDGVVAFYPLASSVEGIDLVVELDDYNGATPAVVTEKIRAGLSNEFKKSKDPAPELVESTYGGAKVVSLSSKSQQELLKGFHTEKQDPRFNLASITDDKTFAYATVGNTVIFSSSIDLLHRAIDAQQGRGALLSSDPELASIGATLGTAQTMGVCSLVRVAQGIDAFINWDEFAKTADPKEVKVFKGLVDLIRTSKKPISGTASYGPDGMRGRAFIPMDYDQTISLLGEEMKMVGDLTSGPPMTPDMAMPTTPPPMIDENSLGAA